MAEIPRPNYDDDPVKAQRTAMAIVLIDPATGAPYKLEPGGVAGDYIPFNSGDVTGAALNFNSLIAPGTYSITLDGATPTNAPETETPGSWHGTLLVSAGSPTGHGMQLWFPSVASANLAWRMFDGATFQPWTTVYSKANYTPPTNHLTFNDGNYTDLTLDFNSLDTPGTYSINLVAATPANAPETETPGHWDGTLLVSTGVAGRGMQLWFPTSASADFAWRVFDGLVYQPWTTVFNKANFVHPTRKKSEVTWTGLTGITLTNGVSVNLVQWLQTLGAPAPGSTPLGPMINTASNKFNFYPDNATAPFKLTIQGTWAGGVAPNRSISLVFSTGARIGQNRTLAITPDAFTLATFFSIDAAGNLVANGLSADLVVNGENFNVSNVQMIVEQVTSKTTITPV